MSQEIRLPETQNQDTDTVPSQRELREMVKRIMSIGELLASADAATAEEISGSSTTEAKQKTMKLSKSE